MSKRYKRIIKTILKFGLTTAALVFVFNKIPFSSVIEIFAGVSTGYLLIALLLFIASKAVSAYRLNFFFRRTDLRISETLNMKLYILGMFYNLFLPGGIGGDGYKIYLLQKHYEPSTARLFGAVLTDRLTGMSALAILALLLFASIPMPLSWNWAGYLAAPLVVVGIYLFCWLFYRHFLKVLIPSLSLSMLVQLLQLLCVWMIILALHGVDAHLVDYLLVFLVSSIVAVFPVSIGGMGVRELTFLYGAQLLGIDQSLAVSISLMFYLITALVSLAGIRYVIKPIRLKAATANR